MSVRRSKLDIVLSVLSAVMSGVDKPTRIMYAVNLSWTLTKRILESLVEKGFLSVKEAMSGRSRRRYEITEKGVKVLKYFNGAEELINSLNIY